MALLERWEFEWDQMDEIHKGLKQGLDVSAYADTKISSFDMKKIGAGLKAEQARPVMQLNKPTGKGLGR